MTILLFFTNPLYFCSFFFFFLVVSYSLIFIFSSFSLPIIHSQPKVVISAAVLSKTGRTLLARNFIPVSKNRIEGYLQSFPKLVGTDSQHTFIETENIRYVYQPMETLYILLLT